MLESTHYVSIECTISSLCVCVSVCLLFFFGSEFVAFDIFLFYDFVNGCNSRVAIHLCQKLSSHVSIQNHNIYIYSYFKLQINDINRVQSEAYLHEQMIIVLKFHDETKFRKSYHLSSRDSKNMKQKQSINQLIHTHAQTSAQATFQPH